MQTRVCLQSLVEVTDCLRDLREQDCLLDLTEVTDCLPGSPTLQYLLALLES
jgi:hypothetical protein